jgi:hypothetical protein
VCECELIDVTKGAGGVNIYDEEERGLDVTELIIRGKH